MNEDPQRASAASRYPEGYSAPIYSSLIYDEDIILDFYEKVLAGMPEEGLHYVSIAARNKYLSEEEKETIRLGHTCMLGKTIIKHDDAKKYLNKIYQLDAASWFYMDFNGNYLPRKCMVIYANINPSSSIKAINEFKKTLAEYDKETSIIALNKRDPSNLIYRYKNIYNNLLTCYQTQRAKKRWIDIDCDIENLKMEESLNFFNCVSDFCKASEKFKNVHPVAITTHGGLHILLNTDGLKSNPEKIVKILKDYAKVNGKDYKEIVINKNEMVPIPGTIQNGYRVGMIY